MLAIFLCVAVWCFQTIALNSCSPTMKNDRSSSVGKGETVPIENKPRVEVEEEKNEEEEEEEEDEGNAMEPVAGRLEIRVLDRAEGSAVVETVNNNLPPTSHVPTKRPEEHPESKKLSEYTSQVKVMPLLSSMPCSCVKNKEVRYRHS